MGEALGMKMWTQPAQTVDNAVLFTPRRTTPLQDVSLTVVSCELQNHMTAARQPQFPQSPALITVIRSIYVHPHIAITTSRQRGHGALI